MLLFRKVYRLPSTVYRPLIILAFVICNLAFIISPVHAQAPPLCPPGGTCPAAGVQQLQDLVVRMIALVSGLAAVVVIIMFVYSGIRFMTSNGEPKNIQAAQQIVTWAVIGTAALILSWIILLVIGQFSHLTSELTHVCFRFDGCP